MWTRTFSKIDDTEYSGTSEPLYPTMTESPDLRWSFIRKVYSILGIQLLLTVGIGAFVVSNDHPIVTFLTTTPGGITCYCLIILTSIIIYFPLARYHRSNPLNYVLLGIFTISFAFSVGLACAFTRGNVVFEAALLTLVVFISLTLYTFWAVKRGHDLNSSGLFLFSVVCVFISFFFVQIFFPRGKLTEMMSSGFYALIICAYMVYGTDNLIKRYNYDEYIWAAVALYLDIIRLFITLLRLMGSRKR